MWKNSASKNRLLSKPEMREWRNTEQGYRLEDDIALLEEIFCARGRGIPRTIPGAPIFS
jgi:hypothetical protein